MAIGGSFNFKICYINIERILYEWETNSKNYTVQAGIPNVFIEITVTVQYCQFPTHTKTAKLLKYSTNDVVHIYIRILWRHSLQVFWFKNTNIFYKILSPPPD